MTCLAHGAFDAIAMLCEVVKDAGGVMRLYGQPTEAEGLRAAAQTSVANRIADVVTSGLVAWPSDKSRRYNGSGEPCDMWTGPCCCGATHKDGL